MKNVKYIVIIAIAALVGFSMTACSDDSTPAAEKVTYESSDTNNSYKLEITQSTAKAVYDPQQGDSYVLTITPKPDGPPQKSTGTVQSKGTGGELTLKPSKADAPTFKVTATPSAGMTKITGEITPDTGTPVSAGTLTVDSTPNEPSGGGNNGGGNSGGDNGGSGGNGGGDNGGSGGGTPTGPTVSLVGTWVNTSYSKTRADVLADINKNMPQASFTDADLARAGFPAVFAKESLTISATTITYEESSYSEEYTTSYDPDPNSTSDPPEHIFGIKYTGKRLSDNKWTNYYVMAGDKLFEGETLNDATLAASQASAHPEWATPYTLSGNTLKVPTWGFNGGTFTKQ